MTTVRFRSSVRPDQPALYGAMEQYVAGGVRRPVVTANFNSERVVGLATGVGQDDGGVYVDVELTPEAAGVEPALWEAHVGGLLAQLQPEVYTVSLGAKALPQ